MHVGLAHAADPKPTTPDAEFLEFLGNGDDADPELQKYLAKREPATSTAVAVKTEVARPAAKDGSEKP
jgi:hypothetical protein